MVDQEYPVEVVKKQDQGPIHGFVDVVPLLGLVHVEPVFGLMHEGLVLELLDLNQELHKKSCQLNQAPLF